MSNEILYNSQVISFLEELWGDGFLSPGGSDEVKKVIEGIQIKDKRVLDIGSGSGACAVLLAKDYSAKQVVGIDVEPPVCKAAQNSVLAAGLSEKISIELVSPGKLPFEDGSFDIVFSKDSIIHIPDKSALAEDVFRVLKPGGHFAASDWLISHSGQPSYEMSEYIKAEGLDFAMASPGEYQEAFSKA
jgi:ubiquinone/menaquinone biosynthesis C-methylase UbiE